MKVRGKAVQVAGGRRCADAAEGAICHVARGAQARDADPAGVVGCGGRDGGRAWGLPGGGRTQP